MFQHIGKNGKRYYGKKGAGIIFTDGYKILLIKRSNMTDYAGKWCIPGGKAKGSETPLENAKRESQEEVGVVKGERFASFEAKDGHHTFTVFMFKVPMPFDVRLSKEHNEYKWTDIEDIKKLPLHPEFAKHLPYYLKAIRKKFPKNFSEWVLAVEN